MLDKLLYEEEVKVCALTLPRAISHNDNPALVFTPPHKLCEKGSTWLSQA